MQNPQSSGQHAASRLFSPQLVHGDERERACFHAGGTVGMYLGVYFSFVAALLFALFGHILVPFVLLAVGTIPALTAYSYAQKRGVDTFAVLARGAGNSALVSVATLVILLLMSAAMVFTTVTGAGLLEFELPQTWADRFSSAKNGAAVGAGFGAVLGYLAAAWAVRQRRKQLQAEPFEDDD